MNDLDKQTALSQWIRYALEHEIALTDDVLNFLDATFGTRDLSTILADADASEIDSMLELLFYPDTMLQVNYEAQWGWEMFTEQDMDAVIALICAAPLLAEVVLPGTQQKITIPVPAFVSRTFVQRMNICWQPPPRLAQAIDEHCTKDERGLMTRVQLRHTRVLWNEGQLSLMCRFLSHMPAHSETFEPDLEHLISILPEMIPESDPFTFLVNKKFFYFQSLCSAKDYERKRLSSNMEIMMLAGARSAHGSIDQWRQLMRRIDGLSQALYGRTQFFQQPDSHCVDLQDGLNMRDVTRFLS